MRKVFLRSGLILYFVTGFLSVRSVKAQNIYVSANTHIVAQEGTHLVIQNAGIQNEGVVKADTVDFIGTLPAAITGNATSAFRVLNLDKPGTVLQLQANVQVQSQISMKGGIMDIADHTINLGDSGSIQNETADNFITGSTGSISRYEDLAAPSGVNPGNVGVEITSALDLGRTFISRGYDSGVVINATHPLISRSYAIFPSSDDKADATLKLYYNDKDVPDSIAKQDLYVWHYSPSTSTWQFLGRSAIDSVANFVEIDHVDSLGFFALSTDLSDGIPLSVKLSSFSGLRQTASVLLHWTTASELNNDYFSVERSQDGSHFIGIGKVSARATAGAGTDYSFLDPNPDVHNFYRLKIFNRNGGFDYSKIIQVADENASVIVKAYPNPAGNTINIGFSQGLNKKVRISLYDLSGRELRSKTVALSPSYYLTQFDLSGLAKGVYLIRFDQPEMAPISIIKQ